MKTGALASTPSRRSWITWPISWTNSSSDEAERELPAPDQAVGRDRDEHRARGREQLELRQQQQDALSLAPITASGASRPPPARFHHGAGGSPNADGGARSAGPAPRGAASRTGARGLRCSLISHRG